MYSVLNYIIYLFELSSNNKGTFQQMYNKSCTWGKRAFVSFTCFVTICHAGLDLYRFSATERSPAFATWIACICLGALSTHVSNISIRMRNGGICMNIWT